MVLLWRRAGLGWAGGVMLGKKKEKCKKKYIRR
jgi:hypothetical protein